MISVKYPNLNDLDGKVHKIEIDTAWEINRLNDTIVLVYGLENGKIVSLILKYIDKYSSYIFIPYSRMELISITSPYLKREDVTEKIIEEIDGKKINNILEINQVMEKSESVLKSNNDGYFNNYNFEDEEISIKKKNLNDKEVFEEEKEIDVMEFFSKHKQQSLNLIYNVFRSNIGKYQDLSKEKIILKLLKELMNSIILVPSVIYNEDDLIDVGLIVNRVKYDRVLNYSNEEFNKIINSGYEKIEELKNRVKRR